MNHHKATNEAELERVTKIKDKFQKKHEKARKNMEKMNAKHKKTDEDDED